MNKYFTLEESPYKVGKYSIKINFDLFPNMYTEGSYCILPARLMGLSYTSYLRMCRDVFEGEIIGKNNKYPIAYFTKTKKVQLLLKILNSRAELIFKIKNSHLPEELINEWQEEYYSFFGKEPGYTMNLENVEEYGKEVM